MQQSGKVTIKISDKIKSQKFYISKYVFFLYCKFLLRERAEFGRKLRQTSTAAGIRPSTSSRFWWSFYSQQQRQSLTLRSQLTINGVELSLSMNHVHHSIQIVVSLFHAANVSWFYVCCVCVLLRKGFPKNPFNVNFFAFITTTASIPHSYNKYYRLNLIRFRLVGHTRWIRLVEVKKKKEYCAQKRYECVWDREMAQVRRIDTFNWMERREAKQRNQCK